MPRKSKKASPKKATKALGRTLGPTSRFVLSQDANLAAAEVVKRAAAEGIKIDAHRVHNIRWSAKNRRKAGKAAPAAKIAKPSVTKAVPSKQAIPTLAKTRTKKAYVLGFPQGTTAGDVVAKAKSEGITLSTAHVYAIRTAAKAKAKTKGKVKTAPKAPATPTVAKPAFRSAPRTGSVEEQFVGLVLDIGFVRASELLGKLKERARQITLA